MANSIVCEFYGVDLRLFACWYCWFEYRPRHQRLCDVCCQVEVSVSGLSLVPRSPTERDIPECECKASIKRSWSTRYCCAVEKMLLLPQLNHKTLSNFNPGPNRNLPLTASGDFSDVSISIIHTGFCTLTH